MVCYIVCWLNHLFAEGYILFSCILLVMDASTLTIHMVSSLDGYVAKLDNSTSWFESKDEFPGGVTLTESDISDFLSKIDCYVMGSRTYEQAVELGWPYGDVPVVVLTSRTLTSERKTVSFYNGDLSDLVKSLRSKYSTIWMVGGPNVSKELIKKKLADEVVISILPILMGEGLPFFLPIHEEHPLHLKDSVTYSDGMVELTYQLKYLDT